MMTQAHCNGNDCSSVHAAQLFPYDEGVRSPQDDASGNNRIPGPALQLVENPPEQPVLSGSVTDEMFLWPSLEKIRSLMKKGSSVQQEVEQALGFRSLLISTAMLSMTVVSMILTV